MGLGSHGEYGDAGGSGSHLNESGESEENLIDGRGGYYVASPARAGSPFAHGFGGGGGGGGGEFVSPALEGRLNLIAQRLDDLHGASRADSPKADAALRHAAELAREQSALSARLDGVVLGLGEGRARSVGVFAAGVVCGAALALGLARRDR